MSSTAYPSTSSNKDTKGSQPTIDDASSTITGWKDKACRVCDSFSFFKKSMSHQAGLGAEQAAPADVPNATPPADDTWTTSDGTLPCPPDYTDLGNSAWAFLHTVASYYPEQPTEQVGTLHCTLRVHHHPTQERLAAQQLLSSLSRLYPCGSCAEHLREELKTRPPEVGNRVAFEQWMCRLHNEVNSRLGKPAFDCTRVGERWRDGPPEGRDCA